MDWQPIDTAPHDGTEIMLLTHDKGMRVRAGKWTDVVHFNNGVIVHQSRGWQFNDGWIQWKAPQITHWMPFPPFPEVQGDADE